MTEPSLFPLPSSESLRASFVGKTLREISPPSAILDISTVRQNCILMLNAITDLNLDFRAHVKTHKTTELTRLQVGEDSKDVRLIVSTIIELESLVPLLKEYQRNGAKVNVLYGVPLGPSKVPRLAAIGRELGPGTISVMIDNLDQLPGVTQYRSETESPLGIFIKTDSGYHRAGIAPDSNTMISLVQKVSDLEANNQLNLLGFYSHNSLSYGGDSPDDAMAMLKHEIEVCQQAAQHLSARSRESKLIISVGASPTALSIQNIQNQSTSSKTDVAKSLYETIGLSTSSFSLEIHAGVYTTLDLQQVAASSRNFRSALAAHEPQAMTILAEVISTYPSRTASPEALISAGTLALAREPCKSYPGWGVLTSWGIEGYSDEESVDASKRLIVKRVSQEHGIVGWEDEGRTDPLPLKIGDRVRVWINHACISSANFGWYLIVDGNKEGKGDVVEDVWVKWRGW